MIAEAGLAVLWLAAALALLQAVWGLGAAGTRFAPYAAYVRPLAVAQGLLVLLAFALLIWLFVRTDLSVLLVVANSHVDKPLLYKVAATWGNHEGSMLLWVTILTMSGAVIAVAERRLEEKAVAVTLGVQALLALGFFAFLLFASNPFTRISPAPATGQGLNPLLQDPGLAFHPPTLYIGYVGISVAFSFAVAALLLRQVGPGFARAMRPWVLGAWIFLTLGITAGSYWAYYELGWGGWWFWDPVENASLMPWLAATALLHSVAVLAARDALRAWTVMLALIAFSMSMIGTFLVRSGILTSVHAFAVDPERGGFILALLAIYTSAAFLIFALRIGTVRQGAVFHLFSREGGLVINNILLSAILGIVLIGTLYPLIAEAFFDAKLSVGPPYFNKVTVPITLMLMVALAVGPLLRWRRDGRKGLGARLIVPLLVSLGTAALLLARGGIGWMPMAGLSLATGLGIASVMPLFGRNLRRARLTLYGMVVAHLGISVSIAGMASESAFTQEKLAAVAEGETLAFGQWSVRLAAVEPVLGPNWTAVEGVLHVRRADGSTIVLRPQARSFFSPPTQTNEAALLTTWDGQLYAVLGGKGQATAGPAKWQLRLWWKPGVTLIWIGGVLVALGGLLALVGRLPMGWLRWRRREVVGYAR